MIARSCPIFYNLPSRKMCFFSSVCVCLRTVSLKAACLFDTHPLAPLAQASPMWSGGTCDCGPFGALTTVQPRNDFRLQIRKSREVERGEVMMVICCTPVLGAKCADLFDWVLFQWRFIVQNLKSFWNNIAT